MAALTAFGDSGLDQALSTILQIEERAPAIRRTVKPAAAAPRRAQVPRHRPALRKLRPSRGASITVAASLGLGVLGAAAVTLWNALPRHAAEDRIAAAEPVPAAAVGPAVSSGVERAPGPKALAAIDNTPVEPTAPARVEQTAAATLIVRTPALPPAGAARSAGRRMSPVVVRPVLRPAAAERVTAVATRTPALTPGVRARQTEREPDVQVAAAEPATTIAVPLALMRPGTATPAASTAGSDAASVEKPLARARRDGMDAIRSLRRQW